MPPATAPVTGGTGEFLGATGFVSSQKLPNSGDFVITINKWERDPSDPRAGR